MHRGVKTGRVARASQFERDDMLYSGYAILFCSISFNPMRLMATCAAGNGNTSSSAGAALRRFAFAVLVCCLDVACHQSATTTAEAPDQKAGLQQPLTAFRQVITSSIDKINVHPGQEIKVAVRIENPGTEAWMSAGRYPVTISYKWFKGAEMLPIEGERTLLPGTIGPNQGVNTDVRVVAPDQKGDYTVRVTLVQEGVAWFMVKSNTFLELPATVR